MKTCVVDTLNSGIVQGLKPLMEADGWEVTSEDVPFDLLVLARGTMEPVGRFLDCGPYALEASVHANALLPLEAFWTLEPYANEGASVCFFGGPNPEKVEIGYSAYAASKAMLREAVRVIAAENPHLNIFMLDPGPVATKIHEQTLAVPSSPRYQWAKELMSGERKGVSFEEVYEKLKVKIEGR